MKVDAQSFLSACYFNQIKEDGKTLEINIPTKLSDVTDKWKIVKAHDNLAYTLESILQCFLQFIKTKSGASLAEFFETIFSRSNKRTGYCYKNHRKTKYI